MKYLNDDAPCRDLIWNTMGYRDQYALYSINKMDCPYKYVLITEDNGSSFKQYKYSHIGQVLAHIKNGGPVDD